MRSSLKEIRGVKPKGKQISQLEQLLYSQGYNIQTICKELGIGFRHYYAYFSNPEMFSGSRMKVLSFMTHKPLGYIVNLCMGTSPKSVHWFSEDSLPVEDQVKQIKSKNESKTK